MTYSTQPALSPLPEGFAVRYLAGKLAAIGLADDKAQQRYLTDPVFRDVRIALTVNDPLMFGLTYMRHHLADEAGNVSISPFHVAISAGHLHLTKPTGYRRHRHAYVSPRGSGKSSWSFLILPLWAGCHRHRGFIAMFADSPTQSQTHLQTLRMEIDGNDLIRNDFPEVGEPAVRPGRGVTYADRQDMLMQSNGLVVIARGMTSKTLGTKVGRRRPDWLILDDIEPQEGGYTSAEVRRNLLRLSDTILPLNDFAPVTLAGTVTMPHSLVHQLVRPAYGGEEVDWPTETRFRCSYFPGLYQDADGQEHSLWPEKWPITELHPFRNTREFAKNFMNKPISSEGDYWQPSDVTIGQPRHTTEDGDSVPGIGRTVLWVDPAVSNTSKSDYYGFAVVSRNARNEAGRVWVRHADRRRCTPEDANRVVHQLLNAYPEIGLLIVETNQGGYLWRQVFHDVPVRLKEVRTGESKEVRFSRALSDYQRHRVEHARRLQAWEDEAFEFPNVLNDDVLDAACGGVLYFLDADREKLRRRQSSTVTKPQRRSYL